MSIHKQLVRDLATKQVLKVISGCLNNFQEKEIIETIIAADRGGATYIDIAADPKVISLANNITSLPLCVSSIVPKQLFKCIEKGVKIVEIGNFDAFYSKSMNFNLEDIKNLSMQVKRSYPDITVCTTLPYILSLKEQIELAKFLEFIGVDLVQTEGTINNSQVNKRMNLRMEKSHSTLLTTYNLSKLIKIPIIAASGISNQNTKSAILYGASGVGVRTAISKADGIENKINVIRSIKSCMGERLPTYKKQ
nr:Ycf23 [Erythrotrichia longistipitata]